jgi:NAD(P)-dependent dehydrogenase (short-subunit alcohol dehydrogenase family)
MPGPRRYLVTGSASGIGAAFCRRVAGPGAAFLVHARANEAGARAVAAELARRGSRAELLLADLADPEAAGRLVERAVATLGGLDVVVHNAGFADRARLDELDPARLRRSLDVIAGSFVALARAARAALAAGDAPRIVATSSFVAHSFRTDAPVFLASAAAKAALEAMVRALALELAPDGITVNAVVPGAIEKEPGRHAAMTPEQWAAAVARIPLGRLGRPDDVAGAIAFLAGPDSGYVTGQALRVDGGLVV